MTPDTINSLLLGFLSLGQVATFVVILKLGIQYGRDSTRLDSTEKRVVAMQPEVAANTALLNQHEWRLGSHDARLNTHDAAIEQLRLREE